MSDLQRRSEALLRSRGYLTGSVEKRKRFPAKGKVPCRACGMVDQVDIASDLWNVFDLIAIRPLKGYCLEEVIQFNTVFVQVTSSANHATRRNKIIASPEAKLCILADCGILIQSWKKKDNRWQSHDEWIDIHQFAVGLPDSIEQYHEDQKRQALLARKEKSPDFPPGAKLFNSPILDRDLPF